LAGYPYVQLTRRFLDIGSSDPDDDPQAAMLLAIRGQKQGDTWEDILKLDATIILGSAGSGKTAEVLNQASRLRHGGTAAFVLRLEALCRQPLQQSFSPDDSGGDTSYVNWRRKGGDAVAFLDALDEARLPQAQDTSALADAFGWRSSQCWPVTDILIATQPTSSYTAVAKQVGDLASMLEHCV
jgi:hypothetical protein